MVSVYTRSIVKPLWHAQRSVAPFQRCRAKLMNILLKILSFQLHDPINFRRHLAVGTYSLFNDLTTCKNQILILYLKLLALLRRHQVLKFVLRCHRNMGGTGQECFKNNEKKQDSSRRKTMQHEISLLRPRFYSLGFSHFAYRCNGNHLQLSSNSP